MALLFWDASGLVKRYMPETGRATVNALFENNPSPVTLGTPWGYLETYSILLRRHNSGVIDVPTFTTAVTALQAEVVISADFQLLPIRDALVFASATMLRKHNLNATDAAILTTLMEFVRSSGVTDCALVTADKRLVRAAGAERLTTLDPEAVAASEIPTFLGSL